MIDIRQLDDYRWLIPKQGDMNVDAILFADGRLLEKIKRDATLKQLQNVAGLPGIVGPALAMPDAHQGYGFPIGGVAAFDPDEGVVSPGGVGYDINCGVRLLRTKLEADGLSLPQLAQIADDLYTSIPAGVGVGGEVRLSGADLDGVLEKGASWAVNRGFGTASDLDFTEESGTIDGADPICVSEKAKLRGLKQLGTLGAGNHFVELAKVDKVYDSGLAGAFGLHQGQVVLWLHSGSRGLGHQVCGDYLQLLAKDKDALRPKDRQLISAPPKSGIGGRYLAGLAAAANFAFANRQVLGHLARKAIMKALGIGPTDLGAGLVYDICHNIAKFERFMTSGSDRRLLVHRKGATRALGPGAKGLPDRYRKSGQPVLLPGDMGRASFVLAGTARSSELTFSSAAHGAGRCLSRNAAKKLAKGRSIEQELLARGVQIRARSLGTLAEEMPQAYKDASQVAQVMHDSEVASLVVRTRPLAVIKG